MIHADSDSRNAHIACFADNPDQSAASRDNLSDHKQSSLPQGVWSKWLIASFVLMVLVCILGLAAIFTGGSTLFVVISGFFALVASIICGQIALIESDHIKAHRASFWLIVVILLIGYFLFIFAGVISVGLMDTLMNWN